MKKRFFNTAGPCVPDKHYMIDKSRRFGDVCSLIDDERYFVLHAPRQTGKTSSMLALMDYLNKKGKYFNASLSIR